VTSLVIALDSTDKPPPVSRPEHFLAVAQQLAEGRRKLMRGLTDLTAVSLLELLNAAVSLAEKASELTEISWTADLETCRSVGDLAAEAVVAAERSLDRQKQRASQSSP
jgi:hypothetical protein